MEASKHRDGNGRSSAAARSAGPELAGRLAIISADGSTATTRHPVGS